jgi:biotin carboxylase
MLAEALRARSADCIAVESSPRLPQAMRSRFDPGVFRDVIQHDFDLEKTVNALKSHQPTHVIAGFESGVELAEQLGERLRLPVNGPLPKEGRRDKFVMTEAVRAYGLRVAMQFRSNQIPEILERVRNTLDWPVILKPSKSVASDLVFCCQSGDDVRRAAEAILTSPNVLGCGNQAVLVQEFLEGSEYAVDIVSHEGQKKITAIWEYNRPTGVRNYVGYDAMTLLPYLGERQESLRSYAFDVLDALAIRFGPAHCELMWVAGEPILVEVGARLSAGNNAVLSRICGGICQLDETVESILAPDRFLATRSHQPRLERRAANVFLAPRRQGRLRRVHGLEAIRRLPTFYSLSMGAKPGDQLSRVAGLVTLIDEEIQAIQRDIEVIRELERDGIFEVEQEPLV